MPREFMCVVVTNIGGKVRCVAESIGVGFVVAGRRGAPTLPGCALKQIGVGAGAGEGQDKLVFLDGVDQDPVGFDVAVTIPFKVVVQRMAV